MKVKETAKSAGRYILRSLTPIPTLRKQGSEIAGSIRRTAERLKAARESMKHQQQPQQSPPKGETPEEAFERIALQRAMDDRSLLSLSGKLRVTKFIWLAAGVVSLAGSMLMVASMRNTVLLIVVPLLVICFLVGLGMAVKHAFWEHQVNNRSLHDFRTFIGSPEFFKYLLT